MDLFLACNSDFVVMLLGKSGESLQHLQIGHRVIPCYGLPLETSLALVALSDLFVGVDSCLLHMADQ